MLLSLSSSGSALTPPPCVGTGSISASDVRERDLHRRFLLDAVAVHVDRFQNALRQIFFSRRWQFWYQQIEKD
jgi:hypothetical protein